MVRNAQNSAEHARKWVLFLFSVWNPDRNGSSTSEVERAYSICRLNKVCLFICLFVWWNKTRKTILCLLCWEGSKPPWEWSHTGKGTNHVRTKDSGTYHVRVNLWLTLYKLTVWLASLDLQQGSHLSHSQPPNGVLPCLAWRIGFGRGEALNH